MTERKGLRLLRNIMGVGNAGETIVGDPSDFTRGMVQAGIAESITVAEATAGPDVPLVPADGGDQPPVSAEIAAPTPGV